MKKTKSLISLLLICSFLLSAFSPSVQETPSEQQSTETVTAPPAALPEETAQAEASETETPPSEGGQSTETGTNSDENADGTADDGQTGTAVESLNTDSATVQETPASTETGIQSDAMSEAAEDDSQESQAQIPVLNVTEFVHKQNTADFRIIVSNMGNVDLKDVHVKVGKSTYTLNGSSETYAANGNFVSMNNASLEIEGDEYVIGNMEPGKVVEFVYHIDIPEGFSGAVVNSSVEAAGLYEFVTDEGVVDEGITGTSSASSYILGDNPLYAEIGVSLVDSKDGYYFPGESILHQVVLSNNSEFDMDNVTVSYSGLSASGYEDIPCVFTRICDVNGCSAIPTEKQDSNYEFGFLGSADKENHSAVLFCENGVNHNYGENVSYVGRVHVSGNVLANDEYAPANSQATADSNQVMVEVVIPMTLSDTPEQAVEDTETPDTPISQGAQGSASTLILRADCVNADCIANTDTTKSFYISACNDGDEAYENVALSAVDLDGSFSRYFTITLNQYTANGGYDESNAVTSTGSSVSTGSLNGNTCVVAVFDAVFTDAPKDYTESKTFTFGIDADGQAGTVDVAVDGCYVPQQDSALSLTITDIAECVDSAAESVTHTLKIENTGSAELCGITVTANKTGYFTGRNIPDAAPSYTKDSLDAEDFVNLTFVEDLSETTLNEGAGHDVIFAVTGYQCTEATKTVTATAKSSFDVCTPERTSVIVTPPEESECHSGDEQKEVVFTIENNGNVSLCKVEGEFRIEKDGGVLATENVAIDTGLEAGKSTTVAYTVDAEQLGLESGDAYTVSLIVTGYTGTDEACTEALTPVEGSVNQSLCREVEYDLAITPPNVTECQEMDAAEEIVFAVTNSGKEDFCRLDGKISVYLDDAVLAEDDIEFSEILTAGDWTEFKTTVDPVLLGLEAGDEYEVKLEVNAYASPDGECTTEPVVTVADSISGTLCRPEVPSLLVEEVPAESCRKMSESEDTVFTVTNNGTADFCAVSGTIQVYSSQGIIDSQPIVLEALESGKSIEVTYSADPVLLGLDAGDTYRVKLTVNGYVGGDEECSDDPAVTAEQITERELCEEIKPVLSVLNLNADCIEEGATLKFKGEIDIDENSSARSIEVTTGTINWGGSEYDCTITSVKVNSSMGYRELDESEQSTTWYYRVSEHGEGALGFICEAKTNPKEFMRNGKQLKFEASALVSTAHNEYSIRSNRIADQQKCTITPGVRLPKTGDDTNLPLLIGLVSLFAITGIFTSVRIFRKKKDIDSPEK